MAENEQAKRPVVVALTGASGTIYGLRLIDRLLVVGCTVQACLSTAALSVWRRELTAAPDAVTDAGDFLRALRVGLAEFGVEYDANELLDGVERLRLHPADQLTAPIASGSFRTAGMVVCPCSTGTLGAIANGLSQNLIHRAAEVHLKERRRLILVPREAPLSGVTLENLCRVDRAGAVVLPAAPGFYHRPRRVIDLVDFIVARVCDHLGVRHSIAPRWSG